MILWGRASSVNVQKVLWALDELDIDVEHKVVGGKYGGLDGPQFSALTPVRRVPVLQDGDLALWESHTILRHLARQTGRLATPMARVDMWMEFGSTTLQPPFVGIFWQRVRLRAGDQNPDVAAGHLAALSASLNIMNSSLADGRAYMAGADFSMADIALGSLFYRIAELEPDMVNALAHVAQWHNRIAARTGYQRHIAVSYDELKVN